MNSSRATSASLLPPKVDTDGQRCALSGDWSLLCMQPHMGALREQLHSMGQGVAWDLSAVSRLDSVGALLIWRSWGLREPEQLVLPEELKKAFDRVRESANLKPKPEPRDHLAGLVMIGQGVLDGLRPLVGMVELLGYLSIELLYLVRHPRDIPWKEICASIYKTGAQALPITALLGLLIGIVLSYLFSLQLQMFGANQFIINILGLGIIRELGPLLVSVLVAGRSGSAITAQLGVMRVTEEIDALASMGVSRYLRLVVPKVVALAVVMPLLVLWASSTALIGGMIAAEFQLGIDHRFFIQTLPKVVPISNLWIGLSKGMVFGVAISLVACHYGLRVKPNTESLSRNTTASVVSAITIVIVLDAIFAVLTRSIGIVFIR